MGVRLHSQAEVSAFLCGQSQPNPRTGITGTHIYGPLEVVPGTRTVPEFAIDEGQIVKRLSTKLGARRDAQHFPVLLDGWREILVLLLVESNVQVADGISRVNGRCVPEVGYGLIQFSICHQRSAQIVLGEPIA